MADDLAAYRRKRDTDRSGEPSGRGSGGSEDGPVFVVQRHDASSLHFDFRLEIGGTLVSWAVPKGPSLDPRDKRLATRTEDHPLDYADFEGRIDQGYGAGTVVVWDTGHLENLTEKDGAPLALEDALAGGHLKVALHGQKLTGAFALTHTKMGGDDSNWLLVKVDDEGADRRRKPAKTQPESVLSGRTNEDLEE
ncbi:DNA polymerase ligase N-terminal domain-containing protein [Nocardioides panaciterrulae]|uniref:DNA ligase D-like protein (Predicted 3'-phosphoesterase) n=1 Tax=Nocardioides panaciterrulae TaxID=661492 RepID=A0A7Y9E5P3_9ACTN|nr:DNA polymerase ligase N-terminal domain-containing protein [Nocardioides panaciterrulae]NYD41311.1 DNA ligase D-like protein (predicted 3'-phosphoesterase) [Nocardioides panaciterrulae]